MSCSSGPGACLGIVRPAWATWCPFVICGWKFRSRIAEKSLPRSGSHHQPSPRPSELVSDSNQERSILSTPSESFRVIGFFRENRNHSCEWKHAKKDARGVKKRCNFSLLVFVHSNRRLKSVVDSPRESNRTRGNETRRNTSPHGPIPRGNKIHKIIIQSFKTIPKQISQSSHQHTPPIPPPNSPHRLSGPLCRSLFCRYCPRDCQHLERARPEICGRSRNSSKLELFNSLEAIGSLLYFDSIEISLPR